MIRLSKIKYFNLMFALALSLPLFLTTLSLYRSSSKVQLQLIIIVISVYLLLAILYHLKDKTLTLEIFLEYILIAALAFVVLQGVIF